MRLSKPNTFLENHIVINSRGGGRPGKNGPHTNYMVKCLVFEISNRTNKTNRTNRTDKTNRTDGTHGTGTVHCAGHPTPNLPNSKNSARFM